MHQAEAQSNKGTSEEALNRANQEKAELAAKVAEMQEAIDALKNQASSLTSEKELMVTEKQQLE